MNRSRIGVAIATIALIVIGAILVTSSFVQTLTTQQQATLISTLSADNDALREQLIDNGETPVAPPAAERVEASELPGPVGPAGVAGQDGRGVASFDCRDDGSWLVTYDDGARQALSGSCSSTDGIDGQPGAPGPAGPAGADGAPGPAGANGADGAAGEPPLSWEFTWLGVDYTCSRADPFDPAAPTYTCTQ